VLLLLLVQKARLMIVTFKLRPILCVSLLTLPAARCGRRRPLLQQDAGAGARGGGRHHQQAAHLGALDGGLGGAHALGVDAGVVVGLGVAQGTCFQCLCMRVSFPDHASVCIVQG